MDKTDMPSSSFTSALQTASLAELEREREQVGAAIAQLETHANLLDLAIRWKLERDPQATRGNDSRRPIFSPARPPLREAILTVLGDSGTPMRPTEIYAELERRGWQPRGSNGKGQVHARLSRMVKDDRLSRTGESGAGRYTLPTQETEGLGSAPPE